MDLGIKGKRALVTAASKGLGRGCAEALAQAGVDLVINARGAEALEATATHLRSFGVDVVTVCGDVTSDAGLQAVLAASTGVDILVTNAGGPPPGSWENWTKADYLKAIEANMLTPIALMTALMPAMKPRAILQMGTRAAQPAAPMPPPLRSEAATWSSPAKAPTLKPRTATA